MIPYVVGQWVRGTGFYGRKQELTAALEGNRAALWFAGLRRVGKTSLLREIDRRIALGEDRRLPLVLDLQGMDSPEELDFGVVDALYEAEELLEGHGLTVSDLERDSAAQTFRTLLDRLCRGGVTLTLLCDEADELLAAPESVRAGIGDLWRTVLATSGGRLVAASSVHHADRLQGAEELAALARPLGAPILLGPLAEPDARALLAQQQLAPDDRPPLDAQTIEAIRHACGDHPMLLQLVAKRCLETGSLDAALAQLAAEGTVDHVFSVDLSLVRPEERAALRSIASGAGEPPIAGANRERLLGLGLLRVDGGSVRVGNDLLADWLRRGGGRTG